MQSSVSDLTGRMVPRFRSVLPRELLHPLAFSRPLCGSRLPRAQHVSLDDCLGIAADSAVL